MMHRKYHPRHADAAFVQKAGIKKCILLIFTIACFCCLTIAQTLAFISIKTEPKINTFVPAQVLCEISESFQNNVKTNVLVKNTGNTDAYIRAAIVVNWKDQDGNIYGGAKPILNTDYTLELNGSDWVVGVDGYYYHRASVAPAGVTEILIEKCEVAQNAAVPGGYSLAVEIVASAIQAAPETAVRENWNATVENGMITSAGGAQQ